MINMYAFRPLYQKNENGEVWYFPFDASRYKNLSFICETSVETSSSEDIKLIAEELDSLDKNSKQELVEVLTSENQGGDVSDS